MKVIYIAGPVRAPTPWDVTENIRAAERWAFEVAKLGFMPLCPHSNTGHFHGSLSETFFIDGTAELLRRCDGAVFIPGWPKSMGSQGEFKICAERRIPACDLDGSNVPLLMLSKWLERYLTKGVER
jgi:hypothetical protein